MNIYKRALLRFINGLFGRRRIIRLSRAMMNMALGENDGCMESNGELFLIRTLLKNMDKEGKYVIFDVGANVGGWTTELLKITEEMKVSSKIDVVCFEPSSYTFSILSDNMKSLSKNGRRVHAVNAGLGERKGDMNLYTSSQHSGNNSLYNRYPEGLCFSYDSVERAHITTVDSYCSENNISRIDYLKIDVEGNELSVIKGARQMLERRAVNFIQFEYGGTWIDSRTYFMDMHVILTDYGYVVGKIMPSGIEFYDKYDKRLDRFQYANYLVCRPEKAVQIKNIKPWMM